MKMRFQRLIVLVAFFSVFAVDGGTFVRFDRFGDPQAAVDSAVLATRGITVWITQLNDAGQEITLKTLMPVMRFTSKSELDSYVARQAQLALEGARTNVQFRAERPFCVKARAEASSAAMGPHDVLCYRNTYVLIQGQDGSYTAPDFSGIETELYWILYWAIPGLEWARIELYEKDASGTRRLVYSLDSRFGPQQDGTNNGISIANGFIQIATELAMLGDNSTRELKISMSVRSGSGGSIHTFRVFGPMGSEIPGGTPANLTTTVSDGDIRLDINGGDTGRILQLQTATSVAGPWVNVGEELMVGVEGYPPLYFLKALASATDELRVYRVVTVAKAPFASFTQRVFRLD